MTSLFVQQHNPHCLLVLHIDFVLTKRQNHCVMWQGRDEEVPWLEETAQSLYVTGDLSSLGQNSS